MTSPRSLDMLRWRCSIRAFNDDRPISAYGVFTKYLLPLYGRSTRLWHRRWSAATSDGRCAVTGYGRGDCCWDGLRGRVLYSAFGDAAGDESGDAVE